MTNRISELGRQSTLKAADQISPKREVERRGGAVKGAGAVMSVEQLDAMFHRFMNASGELDGRAKLGSGHLRRDNVLREVLVRDNPNGKQGSEMLVAFELEVPRHHVVFVQKIGRTGCQEIGITNPLDASK